jgi:hypothetical protein
VGAEGTTELSPRHLVICGVSGGVVGPPCAGKEGLLHLGVAQEPKLGLNHLNLVTSLEKLSCLGEERRVSGREVVVGGRSWSGSILYTIATMSRVGHKLLQQLSLLISRLKDRGDSLSHGRRRRRVPVSLSILGPNPSVASVHHSLIQICYH